MYWSESNKMENLFGINVTKSKENTIPDGYVFYTDYTPPELREKLYGYYGEYESAARKAALPLFMRLIRFIAIFFLIIALRADIGILFDWLSGDGISLAEAYHNAPFIFYMEAASLIIVISFGIIEFMLKRKMVNSSEFEELEENSENVIEEIMSYLEIPEDAESIDVLSFKYKIKKGREKRVMSGIYEHWNMDMYVYVRNGYLYLGDYDSVMEIPLTSFRSAEPVKKRAMLPVWNKEEDYDSENYKPYKITVNNQGSYFVHYYKILICDVKGEFELFIPNYDMDIFSSLTGIIPEES